MSLIITKWTCEKCGATYDRYISFGYPEEDIDYKWKCDECGHVNTKHILSFKQVGQRCVKNEQKNQT